MERRVVITGIGVVSALGNNRQRFLHSLMQGYSNVKYYPHLKELAFHCCVASLPDLPEADQAVFTRTYRLTKLKSTGILYGCMAAVEAWADAGLEVRDKKDIVPYWESGCIFGSSSNGVEPIRDGIMFTDKGDYHKMGGRTAQQSMNSGVSAYIGGILGLGNQVTTNASEGATGTESILEAYRRIKRGQAKRMVAGSSEGNSPYLFGAYDGLLAEGSTYALATGMNDSPDAASCPLSTRAAGFVPGAGSGALVLEDLRTARKRGAHIYAEVLGGYANCGAMSECLSVLHHSRTAMEECIGTSLAHAKVDSGQITLVSGDLSGSVNDLNEIAAWSRALSRKGKDFPFLNAPKSILGHGLTASGAMESVACVLQLSNAFVHANRSSRPLLPGIGQWVAASRIPQKTKKNIPVDIIAKLSLGLGDINTCIILKKWKG
ncbi:MULTISPECIES: beta-ketoacyl-[acyl-carrier-protein] synthase family protein [Chitinophagaceae]